VKHQKPNSTLNYKPVLYCQRWALAMYTHYDYRCLLCRWSILIYVQGIHMGLWVMQLTSI